MGWIAPAATAVGTALSAYGQFQGGQNAKDVYEYNQQVAKYQGNYAQQKGKIRLAALERDVRGYISRQRAIAGKSGTVTDEGSNLDTQTRTLDEAEIDASIIRYNADVESWAASNQADLLGIQADQLDAASFLNAGSTLLGGASRFDFKKKQPKSPLYPSRPASSSRFGVRPGV